MKNITNTWEDSTMNFARSILVLAAVAITLMSSGCGQGPQMASSPEQNPQMTSSPEIVKSSSIFTKNWSLLWHLNTNGVQVDNQEIASNDSGNIAVAWRQVDGGANIIMAALYDASENYWSPPVNIGDVNITGVAFKPDVEMDASGNVVAVWTQFQGNRFKIMSSSYDNETGAWSGAIEIDYTNGSHAFLPKVVMDSSGNAMAVWYQHDGSRYSIFSNRYNAQASEWGGAELVEDIDTGDAFHPQVDGNGSGVVIVTWKQFDGQKDSAWVNRYDPVAGAWGDAETIENYNIDHVNDPVIAINNAGDAIVSWYMKSGEFYNVYANIYDSAAGNWGEAVLIDAHDNGDAYSPVVDIDENGNAIVVWYHDDGTVYQLFTRRYDYQKGAWAATVQLDSGENGDAENPQVVLDPDGNAVVVWQRYSVNCRVKGARYDVTTDTWGDIENICDQIIESLPEHIEDDSTTINVYDPRIVFDQSGRAVVLWRVSCEDGGCLMVSILN